MKLSAKIFSSLVAVLLFIACTKDDDGTPQEAKPFLNISNAQKAEGNENNTISFPVNLVGENKTNVIVKYSTIPGSATSGSDFIGVPDGELIFAAGETQKSIEVTIRGDEGLEPDETFEVLLLNPLNAILGVERATGTILNDDELDMPSDGPPSSGFTSPLEYPGYTLVWQDEFQSGTLNTSVWTHEIGNGNGGWGNQELQYYRPENTSFADDEYLVIEAREEAVSGFNYTSSRMITKGNKFFKYGRVDIRAALPTGQGMWPALWMLGENISSVSWPACGEIDIMEIVGHQPSTLHGTAHWEENGHSSYGQFTTLSGGKTFADEFNVFSIIWDENSIRWLLNNVQYNSIDITPAELSEFREEFFFIFNVAVGGEWPGSPDATTVFPQRMYVDYIRVFQ